MLFKKNVLSSSVAVALVGSTMPSFSQAQELEIEEVIVEGGIRASLKKSMDIKRDTAGVADAISAEDMGKFPDTNLAEALQRITGVSIDRDRGEGSKVTVRGFGPEYNMVTLNGRQMPTHAGNSRSFNFSDLASEGVAAVVVNKTGNASVPSGGIGSLINIISTKPLEAGYVRSFGVKATMDQSTINGDKVTPEISGIVSDTFADDTIGVSLSLSHQVRNNANRSASVAGWRTFLAEANTTIGPKYTVASDKVGQEHTNLPSAATQVEWFGENSNKRVTTSIPQNLGYSVAEFDAARTNGQLTIQLRPTDSLTSTVDYTYSSLDWSSYYNGLSAWFSGREADKQDSIWDNSTPNATPIVYREEHSNGDYPIGQGANHSLSENHSLGLNLELYATDRLKLEADFHHSTAESGAKDPIKGTFQSITIASFNRCVSKANFTQEMPILMVGLNPNACYAPDEVGEEPRLTNPNDLVITGSRFDNGKSKMIIEQFKFGGTYDATDYTNIDFGLELTEVENTTKSSVVLRNSWSAAAAISEPGDLNVDELLPYDFSGLFDAIPGSGYEHIQTESFEIDINQLSEIARHYPVTEQKSFKGGSCVDDQIGSGRDFYCATDKWDNEKDTVEETKSAFVQMVHDTEIAELPVNIRLGLRYEETEVVSTSMVPVVIGTEWGGGNEFTVKKKDPNDPTAMVLEVDDGSYALFLPNFDVNVEISDDLVGRFSKSKTVTRPSYNDIKGGTTVNGVSYKYGNLTASSGNPGLLPIESTNLDLSLEWYYGETDFLSVGYFKKDVKNFIGQGTDLDELYGVPDVTKGGLYELTAQQYGIELFDTSEIAKKLSQIGPDNPLESNAGNDNVIFKVRSPINEKAAKVYGWEFNLQHNFGESGFGMIANYTKPWADVSYNTIITLKPCPADSQPDDVCVEDQFALVGLSESANLIGFYDKDGISMRIAYNWRDDFYAGDGQDEGDVSDTRGEFIANNPQHVQSYAQVDLSASYEVTDNLTIMLDGINVTDAYTRKYGREKIQVMDVTQTGPRYNLGVRYTF
jgi:TonB-dependent receptor